MAKKILLVYFVLFLSFISFIPNFTFGNTPPPAGFYFNFDSTASVICAGTKIKIKPNYFNLKGPTTYIWTKDTSSTTLGNLSTFEITLWDSTLIKLTAIDNYNDTFTSSITIFVNQNPEVELKNSSIIYNSPCFKLNQLVVKPTNLYIGMHTWEIDSAPSCNTKFDYSNFIVDKDTHIFWTDYHLCYPNQIDPKIPPYPSGTFKLKFCFQDAATLCATCKFVYLTVDPLSQIEFKPFPNFCYSDNVIALDSYVNMKGGRWELKSFNLSSSGVIYNAVKARMTDSTKIDVNYMPGEYCWRYVNVTNGCPVLDSVCMTVNPKPSFRLSALDTLDFTKDSINLSPFSEPLISNGASSSKWFGKGVSNNILYFNDIVTPNYDDSIFGPFKLYAQWVHPITDCQNIDSSTYYIKAPMLIKEDTINNVSIKKVFNSVAFYPNPANDVLNVKSDYPIVEVTLYNINGQRVYNEILDAPKTSLTISTQTLVSGIYYIKVREAHSEIYKRIEISK